MKFIHLHTHSHYSLLDGLSKIDELIARAKELGMEAIALTDHGNLYGAVEFYKKAKKAGIKPILGCEFYLAPNGRTSRRPKIDETRYHLPLLVKNETGWKNILQLSTKSHLEGFYYKPRIDRELLKEYHSGLICLSGCFSGEIPKLLYNKQMDEAEEAALFYRDLFGDDFYLELQSPEIHPCEDLKALSKKLGIPLVATQDAHYIFKDDKTAHEILLAIQTNAKLDDEKRFSLKDYDVHLKTPEEMLEHFSDIPEALTNTVKIAEKCDFQMELGRTRLPKFETPDGESAMDYLKKLVYERAGTRLGELTEIIQARLTMELSVIEKTGFADYFLIVQDFIRWARIHGIVVGPGRGSAAGSLVSFVLGITNIDPLKYDLLFERFLNPERIQVPDIDIDFTDTRRDEVIAYVREKYGEDKVAQIITFGTMMARAAVRDAGRALGLAYGFCDTIAKLLAFNLPLKESLETVAELKKMYDENPDAKRVLDAAIRLEGTVRHASVHACGVVISAEPLTEVLPLQRAPQGDETILTQFEMHSVEDLGLLKMDFLGLKNLTIIEKTLRLVKEIYGEKIDLEKIPLDDPDAFKLYQSGETTGVFQLECLTGETIISNTTIKKLYEKRNKKSLECVYLDEGKVHKNDILNVVKSGEKDVFTLIAENEWYVKASRDHFFLTENGWKKMGEIEIGEKVLMKTKAKHLVFKVCKTCQKQISGLKDGQSDFCYKCSAKFYSNPSKKISREKIKAARNLFYALGGKPWNQGLTKEGNDILRATGDKISRALSGISLEERWGKEKAQEIKKKLSKRFSGENNPMFGKSPPHRKRGYRDDLGHFVRSSWEADFARILKLHNIKYQYEPSSFPIIRQNGEVMTYTPDFYVPSQNTFYEIKGFMRYIDAEKIELFKSQYPQYNFTLINTTKFAEFALKYKNIIQWECPRIPIERSFKFVSVKEVRPAGREMTYDIVMKSPGNNFVASGFVVHNSSGMRRYLKELKPTELEDIIAMISLYRPGPMELIPSYIARKHGREPVSYLHPKLEPILKNTYGVGVYQEQMMRIARDLAGFTLAEADTLRKAIGKKIKDLLDEQKERLIKGMLDNGISAPTAEKIWELFPPFARYGFNRSHAASYAMISYQTAYLKARYPVEFMASLLNTSGDTDRITFLVGEARRLGITVLPPDINSSFEDFTVDTAAEGETKPIRFGLLAVKNIGANIVQEIIAERLRGGPFTDVADFLSRIRHRDLNKKSLESLVKCGAFDSFKIKRGELAQNTEELLRFNQAAKKIAESNQYNLFGASTLKSSLRLKPVEAVPAREILSWEKELLGLYVSDHPFNSYIEKARKFSMPINKVHEHPSGSEVQGLRLSGVITVIQKITTKKGDPMLFVTIEDDTGKIEVLVFSRTLAKTESVWREGKAILLAGKLSWRDEEPKVICEEVKEL